MPIDITIDTDRRRIHTRAHGCLTWADLCDYYEAIHAHPDYAPDLPELWDALDVTDTQISAEQMRTFSHTTELHEALGETAPVAVLVPDDLAFGLARMYQMLQSNGPHRLRVVRCREEAEAWLDEVARRPTKDATPLATL